MVCVDCRFRRWRYQRYYGAPSAVIVQQQPYQPVQVYQPPSYNPGATVVYAQPAPQPMYAAQPGYMVV